MLQRLMWGPGWHVLEKAGSGGGSAARVGCVLQGLHEVAYSGGLARPLIAPESALDGLSADGLAEFVAQNYTAPRIVLSGAGVTQVRASASAAGLHDPNIHVKAMMAHADHWLITEQWCCN